MSINKLADGCLEKIIEMNNVIDTTGAKRFESQSKLNE